jgi:phytoene synthase
VRGFLDVVARRDVPLDAALELVEGCTMDLGRVRVPDEERLLRYAYLVAGTVGRMMTSVLGSRSESAIPHAISLGIGMQLTNIARDVAEDAANDRVYLPATWLAELGIDQERVARGTADRTKLVLVVRRLVALAERYYRHGEAGLAYLPWRTRIGIGVASRVYRAIGHTVARRGEPALTERTVLSPLARLRHAVGGIVLSIFARPTEAV